MTEQITSLIRTVLKVGAGLLVAKGIGDAGSWELVSGGVVAAIGIVWSLLAHNPNSSVV